MEMYALRLQGVTAQPALLSSSLPQGQSFQPLCSSCRGSLHSSQEGSGGPQQQQQEQQQQQQQQ